MKKLILINLKMYLNSQSEVDNYLENIKNEKNHIIIFPQVHYLEKFIKNGFVTGSQNISVYPSGPHTGEISAASIKDLGASYTLIGHSEIRQNKNEDDQINQKIKIALNNNLKVVLCIGEDIESYNQNKTKEIIKSQILKALKDVNEEIIISYEPVWAIGTGNTPTNDEIKDIVNYIKSLFPYNIKVLYGGSVSETNIATLNQIQNLDGFLIGKAGAIPNALKKIIEVTQK